MSLGSHFIVGFEGTSLTEEIKSKLLSIKPAGVILYDTNIETRDQVKSLCKDLRSLLGDQLIISVDQEGAKVERLRKISTSLPSLWALGKAASELEASGDLSEESKALLISHSRVLATELIDLGFNLVYAPCVDLCTNPANPIIGSRSLGADPKLVSLQTNLIIQTYKKFGLNSCAKHFPGHGDANVDSHLDLCSINYDTEDYQKHLEPFKAAITAGVESVMVAHIAFPKIDPSLKPASMSTEIIKGELKKKLNFKGLVISDEMTMKGISKLGTYAEISTKAIDAGCDLLIWNTNLDEPLEAINSAEKNFSAFRHSLTMPKDLQYVDLQINFKRNFSEMLEIVSQAINFNTSIEKIRRAETALLVFDHPKIEKEVCERALELRAISLFDKDVKDKIVNKKNILILSFQVVNFPEQQKTIDLLRQHLSLNIIQCSCDLEDAGANIDLYGANEVHLKALAERLFD